jgi:hypothetical protein
MKSFRIFLEDIDKKILDMWRDSTEVEDIMSSVKRSKNYIKKLLKKNNRKGWEEL